MGYYNSTVVLQKDGLHRATIRYQYLYFFVTEIHESFKTLSEARDWILSKRCPDHKEITTEEQDVVEDEKSEEIKENVFEKDSDSDSSESEEDTEQKRNVRLNRAYSHSKVLDDIKKKGRLKKKLRWSDERPASFFVGV